MTKCELHIGILIVGSLLWERKLHREFWRQRRLDLARKGLVRAPIRYGRESGNRGNTFTMVFSTDCNRSEKLGQAVIVPCRYPVLSGKGLLEEARNLWCAEQSNCTVPKRAFGASWGCVALLENPRGQKVPLDWLNCWAQMVPNSRDPLFDSKRAKDEKVIIDARCMLNICWPEPLDGPGRELMSSLDAILATPTVPKGLENGRYPSPKAIAEAWNTAPDAADGSKRSDYFWNNRRSKISTFEDGQIESFLNDSHRNL